MFLPKSFWDFGSAASAVRYSFMIFQVKMYTPMEARLLLGCFGFSSNSMMASLSSTFMMPKDGATSHGTGRTAMVTSALRSMWELSIRL